MSIYVDSNAVGLNNGTSWANAYTTLGRQWSPGDIVWVASNHLETATTNTSVSSVDANDPIRFTSVSTAAEPPTTYLAGASVATTGASDISLEFGGNIAIFDGISFTSNDNWIARTDQYMQFRNCTLGMTGTSSSDVFTIVSSPGYTRLENVEFTFGVTGHGLTIGTGGVIEILGCSLAPGSAAPNDFIKLMGDGSQVFFDGSDFSTATNFIKDISGTIAAGQGYVLGYRSKMPTSIIDTPILNPFSRIALYACSSGTNLHEAHFEDTYGITQEDSAIYRSATNDGTNGYSLRAVSTATGLPGGKGHRLHLCDIVAAANATITIELVEDNATALTEADVWVEIIQPDATGPLGTLSSSIHANRGLGTPSALTTSTEVWTGTGGFTNESKYSISLTLSGASVGVHSIWITIAPGAIRTIYVDPSPDIT